MDKKEQKKMLRLSRNTVQFGDWKELNDQPLSSFVPSAPDNIGYDHLDGLVIKGYETKFAGGMNENYEQYDKGALDKFVQEYFVDKNFNLPVDVQHCGMHDPNWLVGRVIYMEVNNTGFYFVAYISRKCPMYDRILWMLKEGLLQGFSKEGYATDWECIWDKDGYWAGNLIKEFKLLSVSLVATPANGVPFEKLQEVTRDGLVYRNTIEKEKDARADLGLFV